MAIDLAESQSDAAPPTVARHPRREDPSVYDRSSLPDDCLVMIAGQAEADYLPMAPENQSCEFLDGVVYMPPRVEVVHQNDLNFLLALVSFHHAQHPIGFITTGPAALRLREGRWVEPDLFVLPEASGEQARAEGFGFPPALLAVEILSPSNRSHDLETKAAAYREALVDEVWYVDRSDRVEVVDRREGDEPGYKRESIAEGSVVARSLAGFWFDAAWLWQEPRPNLPGCLATILAGPPGAA